jgi:hypothetical protein
VAIILLAGVALAVAFQIARYSRMNMLPVVETSGITGANTDAPSELALTDVQRGHIYEVVMRIPDAAVAYAPAPDAANALSEEVAMQDFP